MGPFSMFVEYTEKATGQKKFAVPILQRRYEKCTRNSTSLTQTCSCLSES